MVNWRTTIAIIHSGLVGVSLVEWCDKPTCTSGPRRLARLKMVLYMVSWLKMKVGDIYWYLAFYKCIYHPSICIYYIYIYIGCYLDYMFICILVYSELCEMRICHTKTHRRAAVRHENCAWPPPTVAPLSW